MSKKNYVVFRYPFSDLASKIHTHFQTCFLESITVLQCKGPFKRSQHLLQHEYNTVVEPNVGGV